LPFEEGFEEEPPLLLEASFDPVSALPLLSVFVPEVDGEPFEEGEVLSVPVLDFPSAEAVFPDEDSDSTAFFRASDG